MNAIDLTGPAKKVYEGVFTPLSEQLATVREAKKVDPYGRPPYLKLQTQNEKNLWEVKIATYLIDYNAQFSSLQGAYAGSRNFMANTLNSSGAGSWLSSWSFGYIDPWNCSRGHTATALRTAIAAFRPAIFQFKESLEGFNSIESLETFKTKIVEIKKTIEEAKKTVFYVYRTYDHKIEEGESEELQDQGSGPKGIFDQYQALCDMLNQEIIPLEEAILAKIDLLSSSPQNLEPKKSSSRSSLEFDSPEKASLWFCKQRLMQQKRVCGEDLSLLSLVGKKTHADLQRTCRLSGGVPEAFVNFAKSIDASLAKIYKGNQILSSQFVGEVYERSRKELEKEGLEMPVFARPDNFKMWLKELCSKDASRQVYQTIFTALLNPEASGPYRLDSAPSALNAIMVSEYFSMFE